MKTELSTNELIQKMKALDKKIADLEAKIAEGKKQFLWEKMK